MQPNVSFGFDDSFARDLFPWNTLRKMTQSDHPAANIIENEQSFEIELAAPGMTKEAFKIELKENILTISGNTEQQRTEENANYHTKEFSFTSFSRGFSLPEKKVNKDGINATYVDGILKVTIPKLVQDAVQTSRMITIQ